MSQHSVELVAKFKDNATPGLRRLAAEAEKTGSRQLQKAAAVKLKHQEMYSATARLGIRTEHQIRREIQQTQAAYNRLAKSGMASQRELARAAQITRSRVRELTAEINGGASRLQRIGSGVRTIGRGVAGVAAGAAAGAYVLAQPVNRTMDFDTSLRHAANTMYAGKSMAEKRAGMEEIKKSVMDAAYVGGTTRDAALEAMNTMVASGAMSDEAVKKLLPTVMKTATAANTEGNDIANIVTKALQAGFKEADIPSLLDRALQSGADGGFELKDMSRWLPQQLAAMKNAGMGATLDNFSSLLNANQLSFMTAGSTDEAGNNLVNLLAKINSQDIVTKAKKITINGKEGFDFTASMNKRQAAGMNSLDALVDIVGEITAKDKKSAALMKQINAAQGDEAKLALLENQKALVDGTAIGKLVSDRQALMALLALVNNKQELTRLQAGQTNAAGRWTVHTDSSPKVRGLKNPNSPSPNQKPNTAHLKNSATASAAAGTSSMFGGGGLLSKLFGGSSRTLQAGRLMPSASSLGPVALGATPLAVMGGATHLAGQRDKYAEWSKPFAKLSSWLESILPDFSAGAKAEYLRKREELGGNNAPLDSPVLKESMAQLNQSAQTNQQASQQYVQAAAENQAATAQITGAAAQMTAAAAQMQAAAGKPIPITVTVQNGNIMAYVNQAVERNSRKN
ncbi:phage tail tape measure protein [Neisseria meningitidis]|uniref:phage tail tape measure protein n=2 Tax=Neisseria meningitidis TaxID=487 RepID=UPI0005DF994D|nr:phage tail tape measure protein [Neisseria meningitidis]CKK14705.1 Phage-related minor tail protein [Neisseria meningitidis]